jgi:hypothetical protein
MRSPVGRKTENASTGELWLWRRLTVQVGSERYIATVSEGPRNWSAHIARLPGLVVTGPYAQGVLDRERVRRKLAEGIEFHLEGLALEAAESAEDGLAGIR